MDDFLKSWLLSITFAKLTKPEGDDIDPEHEIVISFSSSTPENYFETPCKHANAKWVDLSKLQDSFIKINYEFQEDLLEAMVTPDEVLVWYEDWKKGKTDQSERLSNQSGIALMILHLEVKFQEIKKEVKEPTLVEFSDLQIKNADEIAMKNQTISNSENQEREFIVSIKMNNQEVNFNMENPEADSKKGVNTNSCVFMINNTQVDVKVQEKHYRLERDEEAFIASLRENMGSQEQMTQFLNNKAGDVSRSNENQKKLGDMIPKKRVPTNLLNPKTLFDSKMELTEVLNAALGAPFGTSFEMVLTDKITLTGKVKLLDNEFCRMPRGQLSLKIEQYSKFKKDQYEPYQDLVFLFTKETGRGGETMTYKVTEQEIVEDTVKYETYHNDDFIKLEVFQKNSVQKNSKLGKAFINIRDLGNGIYPITLKPSNYGQKKLRVNGNLFLNVEYSPRSPDLFYPAWRDQIFNICNATESFIDRFEHLNDFLDNEFTSQSQYGSLMVELNKVQIPEKMKTAETDVDGAENKVYMLKIRVRTEVKVIYVGSPDQIYGDQEESVRLWSTVQSLRDVVYVEFYDVLEEENFDPKVRQPMSNLRLLSHQTFEVKDLPFDKDNNVESYSLLMPIDFSKKVAEFKFVAKFCRALPMNVICKPLEQHTGYMLTSRLIFNKEFAINHDKGLDKANVWCQIKNLSQPKKVPVHNQRIFFNKEILPLGQIFIKVGDEIQMSFYVKDPDAEDDKKDITAFSHYHFMVDPEGFKAMGGFCKDEILRDVKTWRATMTSLDLNYIEDGSLGMSSLSYNRDQAKKAQAGAKSDKRRQGLVLNPIKNLNKTEDNGINILIKTVDLEFEVRRSHLTDFYAQDYLASCVAEIKFDEENIEDLQNSGEIESDAKLVMEVVSKDKNCRKTKIKEKELIEYLPKVIPQRLFLPDDVIQIQILNTLSGSHCVQLKPIDLPLTTSQEYIHWAQIGTTSQIKLTLNLRQSEKLMKEIEANRKLDLSDQAGGATEGIDPEAEKKKIVAEIVRNFQKSTAFAKDPTVGMLEKIVMAKKLLTEHKQANKEMITKQNRLKMECEKALILTQKARDFKEVPKKEKKEKEVNYFAQFSSGPLTATGDAKAKASQIKICACGDTDPKFKGYCENCVKKLKKKFDYLIEKFNKLKDEYDQYSSADVGKGEEKMKLLKNKMAQYGAVDANMLDVMSKHEKLMNSEENRAFAEFKVNVQSMAQELKIMKARQAIELDELRKQQNNLDVQIVKQIGKKRDLEGEVDQLQDKSEELVTKQEDIENLVILKKRFAMQCERLQEKKAA